MLKTLVISGGSTKCISTLGCIQYLEEHDIMNNVTTFVGTSGGAIIALFLALGYSVAEILVFLTDNLMGNKLNKLDLDEIMSLNIISSFGLDSGGNMLKLLHDAVMLKLHSRDVTFLDMAKIFGKNLVVCVANITNETTEYFSVETHPEASVVMAVRMSFSLPYIFTPIQYKGCYYVDGGLYETLPLSYCQDSALMDTLALNVKTNRTKNNNIHTFVDFSTVLLTSVVRRLNDMQVQSSRINKGKNIRIVDIHFSDDEMFHTFDCNGMQFTIDDGIINVLLARGYQAISQLMSVPSSVPSSVPKSQYVDSRRS